MKLNIRRELLIVLATLGMGTLAMSILGPVMPLYLTSIGIGPVVLGLMLSVAMAGMAIGESFWGLAADRTGLMTPMITGTFLCAASVYFFVVTRNAAFLFTIFFVWGFVRSALFGPGRGYVAGSAPPMKKATFMAFSAVMLSASRSLATLPSGFMVESWGYPSVFYASTGISVIGGLLVLAGLRKARLTNGYVPPADPAPAAELPVSESRLNYISLTPQCVVTALMFVGMGTTSTFLPLLATQVVGVDAAGVGILFTIGGLTNMALGVPSGMLADRIGKKRLMITGLMVSAGAIAGMAWSGSFAWLIIFMVVNAIGSVMFNPAALGLLSDSVPPNRQSSAMGLYGGVCENTGIIAGSALGGVIWSAFGPQPAFLMATASCGLAAAICLLLVKDTAAQARKLKPV